MSIILTQTSIFTNIAEFIAIVVIFVLIVVAAYLITVWIGNTNMAQHKNKNIKVLEVYRISPNKLIEIVKVGNKYIVLGVCKDSIEYILELKEDEFTLPDEAVITPSFKDILSKLGRTDNKSKG